MRPPESTAGALARKVFFTGTHRVRHPEDTWGLIAPLLGRFGITRIADVTGLDTLGIPVAVAVRPLASSLSSSQGKGLSYPLARISATMEAIELWHAENAPVPLTLSETSPRRAAPGYDIRGLFQSATLVGLDTPLDWVNAVGLRRGATVPVPSALVHYPKPDDSRWTPFVSTWTSNGLAAGNSFEEACLHALYEIVERDAISSRGVGGPSTLDLGSLTDPDCAALVASIRESGGQLEVAQIPSRVGLACFQARIWSEDFPVSCLGWGAHSAPEVALIRAITEAAQSRLTAIVGHRDDLPSVYGRVAGGGAAPATSAAPSRDWNAAVEGLGMSFETTGEELDWLAARIELAIGGEAVAVDLSTCQEFSVVRVLVPGARFDGEIVHGRR